MYHVVYIVYMSIYVRMYMYVTRHASKNLYPVPESSLGISCKPGDQQ